MIIYFKKSSTRKERADLAALAAKLLPGASVTRGEAVKIKTPKPEKLADAAPVLENMPGVKRVKLSGRELCPRACAANRKPFSSPLDFTRRPVFIAGPCAVEDEKSYLATAMALKSAGAHALRAALFKPRSSPYAFQGIGWAGLKVISRAKKLTGLPLVTEVTDPRQVERLAAACDVLQVGARNMRNYELLKEAAGSGRAVLLKRGLRATLTEWLLSAEYLLAGGAKKVVLCERGDSLPGRPRLDLMTMAAARKLTGLPVIADPSHAAGDRRVAAALARRALGAGADGLLIEVSSNTRKARVDGRQTLSVDTFRDIAGT